MKFSAKRGTNVLKTLIVIDGNSLLNRSFYGIRDLSTPDGIPTNATYGFISTLKRYLDRLAPTYRVCTFDTPEKTFRHEKYDGYKANRHGMPDDLAVQLPYAKRAAKALGFEVLECPGYEADDVIGTVCRSADERGDIRSFIVIGDRDSLQLISDKTSVWLLRNREDELFDGDHFREVYSVSPDQFVDVKALMGDSSDCIPGVPGIGEKTALKLISASGGLDELYADEENGFFGSTPSVKQKLSDGKESAYMSRELARICRTAPVGGDIDGYESAGIDGEALYSLLNELYLRSLIDKFHLSGSQIEMTAPTPEAETVPTKKITSTDAAAFGIKEGDAVTLNDSGLSFFSGGTLYTCEEPDGEAVKNILARPIVCHDFKALCTAARPFGVEPECAFDTKLAAYLLEPGRSSYPLPYAAEKAGVAPGDDAAAIKRTADALAPKVGAEGMTQLLREVEIPLSSVLSSMERRGFKTDPAGIIAFASVLKAHEDELAAQIYMLAGHDFNINSPKQLGTVLFEEMGLRAGKKTKTGYSTDAETLSSLRFSHPIIGSILEYREIAKLRGTYGENLAAMADGNGFIHTTFNQCGTATGRLSSNDPNLQNIPVRGSLGRELRRYFTARGEDRVLIDADYSQIELRLLAHLSGDERMIEGFKNGEDIHAVTASEVFGVPKDQVTPELRRRAKAVNFGIVYGIGAFSLSQDLGITRKSADEYIKGYLAAYPKVDEYLKRTVEEAIEKGYTETMLGRRRYIPELSSKNRNVSAFGRRVAMNSPIQGSAADVIKIAMIRVERALREAGIDAILIMQVHDELIIDSAESCADEAAAILKREMEGAASLSVPLSADTSRGKTWYDAK
ncbi:MAG: DNA polymerase I [Clostridia bacterium]|nr:DNA polymerase I [Clostridia bacterium]